MTVEKATLHNEEDLERKDIREGDEVVIMRAGDVIPQVVSPITQRRTGKEKKYRPPRKCPACGTPTVKPEGEVWTRCPNRYDCPGQALQALKHFTSKGAMDIEGYGEKLVYRFYDQGLVRSLPDIYRLTVERLEPLEGFQHRSAENLVQAIERSKQQPFQRVLYGLGIPGIGYVNARALASHFGSIDNLMAAGREQIEEVEGIGPVLAGVNQRDARRAPQQGGWSRSCVRPGFSWSRSGRTASGELPLAGKTFVLTGTLEGLSREQATERIEELGGKVTGSVSGKTDSWSPARTPGAKLDKARDLERPVIDGAQLEKLLAALVAAGRDLGHAAAGECGGDPAWLRRAALTLTPFIRSANTTLRPARPPAEPGQRADADQRAGLGPAASAGRGSAHALSERAAVAGEWKRAVEGVEPGLALSVQQQPPDRPRRDRVAAREAAAVARGRAGADLRHEPGHGCRARDGRPRAGEASAKTLQERLGEVVV